MLRRHLLVAIVALGCLGASARTAASEQGSPGEPTRLGVERHSDISPVPAAAVAEPAAATAPAALSAEFAERLAAIDTSLTVADREDRSALSRFYAARQSAPLWVNSTGLLPQGVAVAVEIGKADDWGLEAAAFRLPAVSAGTELSTRQRADAEITLSLAILKYARYARGGRAEPTSLSRNLDRKLPLRDPGLVIEEIAKATSPDAYLRGLHPQHPQFEALRQKYLALRSGPTTTPVDPAVRKLLVNMEEWRWMPDDLGDFYVWVNVPEFTLRIVKHGKVIFTERVIVGKPDKQTPIFSQNMEQVIFHPFWGVPDSIKKNDILPSLARGSTRILERHNLRIQLGGRDIDPATVDWTTVDMRKYHVYQPPGGSNVLGFVKFRFPNKHDVYMHDTPDKQLFNAQVRAFSHGCMRVRDPQRFAEVLLAEDQGWPASRIAAAISSGPQNNAINLQHTFPVHITYFTHTVEEDGKLKSFADIYGHEFRINMGMAGKAHLIPKTKEDTGPIRAEVGALAESGAGAARRDSWIGRAFGN
jgi:murein L,D-transpeptidase YcbB/YkuD